MAGLEPASRAPKRRRGPTWTPAQLEAVRQVRCSEAGRGKGKRVLHQLIAAQGVVLSISLVGFGMVAAVMPLLSPEKGQQVTYIFTAVLLLVSGIYYEVDVLPGWMQPFANISPVYYALNGIREALLHGASFASQWPNIWPLLIMGAVFPPLGLYLFQRGEIYAKKTGLLKRSG